MPAIAPPLIELPPVELSDVDEAAVLEEELLLEVELALEVELLLLDVELLLLVDDEVTELELDSDVLLVSVGNPT